MQTVRDALLILICLVLLGACGHKGPLYLPKENPDPKPASSQETDADSAENKEEEEKDRKE